MNLTEADLQAAVEAGIVDAETARRLRAFAAARAPSRPAFALSNILWYLGTLIVIGAMGLFSMEAFSRWGGLVLAAIAVAYAAGFAAAGHHFWHARQLRVLGGLLVTVAAAMAPLAMFGLQQHLGWLDDDPAGSREFFVWVRASSVPMELAAIAAGLLALAFYRFSFVTIVVALGAWFLAMDIADLLVERFADGQPDLAGYALQQQIRAGVSLALGAVALAAAWWLDLRGQRQLTLWPHIAAGAALLAGVAIWLRRPEAGEPAWAALAGLSLGLVLFSLYIRRRSYLVFGGLGLAAYVGHLAFEVFRDSLVFTLVLTIIGVAVIALGYAWMKLEPAAQAWMGAHLPPALSRLRPS